MKSARTSCDQPTTKIASGRSARTASIVSGAFTSAVWTSGAPISSKEHWPERFGSIGPGRVTTPAISAPASRAASSVSRPMVSKLTQTARTGADSTEERRRNRSPHAAACCAKVEDAGAADERRGGLDGSSGRQPEEDRPHRGADDGEPVLRPHARVSDARAGAHRHRWADPRDDQRVLRRYLPCPSS